LRGEHHLPFFGDAEAVVAAINEFLRKAPPDPQLAKPVTARELDVLRLLADGAQDREIATQLHISTATVGRHLANIYVKLGVSTRAAAVGVAVRRRLV
jgi:DNA-binding NarL/FixJ family response regulator